MIIKAALLLFRNVDGKNELLFIKTHSRDFYIFPGDVQTDDTSLEDVLRRSVKENLGVELEGEAEIGVVKGHTPSGVPLEMHLFTANADKDPVAQCEIEKLWWMDRDEALQNADSLTPIALEEVFPFLQAKEIW